VSRIAAAACLACEDPPTTRRVPEPAYWSVTYAATRAATAAKVAASLGIRCTEPAVLADGANVIVHLAPAPVVAKVAASTVAVRPDNAAWLQRELDVTQFLAGQGAPVMTPSPEMPATVYHGDGQVMTFWRYLSPSGGDLPGEQTIGSMLRDLHAALRSYPVPLPLLAPLGDIPEFLVRPQTRLPAGRTAAMAAAYARLTAELRPDPAQPLHGDAGAGNLMATSGGWVWHDFEDTCSGPLAWDLAPSIASPRLDGPRVLAAYGEPVDDAQLAVCRQLRRLHLTVWYALYAERLPRLRSRADELLALWPAPQASRPGPGHRRGEPPARFLRIDEWLGPRAASRRLYLPTIVIAGLATWLSWRGRGVRADVPGACR
jgi:Phosphotransferase enzyme family